MRISNVTRSKKAKRLNRVVCSFSPSADSQSVNLSVHVHTFVSFEKIFSHFSLKLHKEAINEHVSREVKIRQITIIPFFGHSTNWSSAIHAYLSVYTMQTNGRTIRKQYSRFKYFDEDKIFSVHPQIPVKAPVLNRLAEMFRPNLLAPSQIRNRASHFQYPVVCSRRKSELCHCHLQ